MCLSLKPTMAFRSQGATPRGPGIVISKVITPPTPARVGSLRPKIWELSPNAHCPVIGVCLPLMRLQMLLGKAGHQVAGMGHYEQHLVAVGECRKHSRLAEIVQKDLDRQFQLTLQSFKGVKETSELLARWQQARTASHWAGVFWAILTHPRANALLCDEILGDVHMLQHQVGMASRHDQQEALRVRQAQEALQAQLAEFQGRLNTQQQAWQKRQKSLEDELAAQRNLAQQAQAQADRAQTQLSQWVAQHHNTVEAVRLKTENQHMRETIALLEKSLRKEATVVATVAVGETEAASLTQDAHSPTEGWQWLQKPDAGMEAARRVVCVGGMPAQIPQYRQAVESAGVSFAHHDGGIEHKLAQLDHCLAQADLVICQTGCISHNAYWRVKDHCKRTGKPCVFVAKPSIQVLQSLMRDLSVGFQQA
jgi:hypothetical protein